MEEPTNLKELRRFIGMTNYLELHQYYIKKENLLHTLAEILQKQKETMPR